MKSSDVIANIMASFSFLSPYKFLSYFSHLVGYSDSRIFWQVDARLVTPPPKR